MKKIVLGLLAAVLAAGTSWGQAVSSFDDIVLWAGEGASATNRAAMVIQWNQGSGPYTPSTLVWGYGWNSGTKTGADMMAAVQAIDMRLQLVTHPLFPNATFGIYYDALNNGSGYVAGTPGDLGGPEDGAANDSGNYYQEGWYGGYWEYSIYGGSFSYDVFEDTSPYAYIGTFDYDEPGTESYASVDWFNSGLGALDRELSDGYWDAYSFAPGFVSQALEQPLAAVPEPRTSLLLIVGFGIVYYAKKRIHIS